MLCTFTYFVYIISTFYSLPHPRWSLHTPTCEQHLLLYNWLIPPTAAPYIYTTHTHAAITTITLHSQYLSFPRKPFVPFASHRGQIYMHIRALGLARANPTRKRRLTISGRAQLAGLIQYTSSNKQHRCSALYKFMRAYYIRARGRGISVQPVYTHAQWKILPKI